MNQSDDETPISNAFTDMWNLKKRTEWTLQNRYWLTDFEKIMVSKWDRLGWWWGGLGVWDGNAIKLGCDDHCTTINVINLLSNKENVQSHRHGSDPELLWLWCRSAAVSPIWPLAWELLYAMDWALKRGDALGLWDGCAGVVGWKSYKTGLWWSLYNYKCNKFIE